MKRRHFLQFTSSTLAAIGLSQLDLMHQGNRLSRVLAQPGNRKLALLVGINDYSKASHSSLGGCLNDVEMQKHLLIHRFGFAPEDVVLVWDNAETADRKPTRANILRAFESHLIDRAQPGDVVLFHYSGHGSQVKDPNPLNWDGCKDGTCNYNGTLAMNEAIVSNTEREVAVNDIMGRTLFLLMSALKTDKVTVVLDSCHAGGGLRGNATVRALRDRAGLGKSLVPSPEELDYQQQWLAKLGWNEAEFQQRRQAGIAKGVAIGSVRRNQLALDAQFPGFQAGAFTYFLTRYLWQQPTTQPTDRIYTNLIRSTRSFAAEQNHARQEPVFDFAPNGNPQSQPFYYCELAAPSAEAVITKVTNGDRIEFWIGGVSSQNIENSGKGSIFNVLDESGEVLGEIESLDRRELYGHGRLTSGEIDRIQPGQLLRERIVGIPANPVLKIGLDPNLGTDLEVGRTELASNRRVEVVPTHAPMDYLLARMTADVRQQLEDEGATELPLADSMGLFSPDRTPIDGTFGRSGEPAINAISRLAPRFRSLLAHQILGQLKTGSSSPLQVSARILTQDNSVPAFEIASRGAIESTQSGASSSSTLPQYPTGTPLQIQVDNHEPQQSLYLSILAIGANGDIDLLFPANWDDPEATSLVEHQNSLTVPRAEDGIEFRVQGSSGFPEILILTSTSPLRNALQGLKTIARSRGIERGFLGLRNDESIDIFGLLLGDVDRISRGEGTVAANRIEEDAIAYNTSSMAVLSATIEAIGRVGS